MTADPREWRIEQYEKMGWGRSSSARLADTLDDQGIHLYWGDVKRMLESAHYNYQVVLDILLGVAPAPVIQYEDTGPLGAVDDGA